MAVIKWTVLRETQRVTGSVSIIAKRRERTNSRLKHSPTFRPTSNKTRLGYSSNYQQEPNAVGDHTVANEEDETISWGLMLSTFMPSVRASKVDLVVKVSWTAHEITVPDFLVKRDKETRLCTF